MPDTVGLYVDLQALKHLEEWKEVAPERVASELIRKIFGIESAKFIPGRKLVYDCAPLSLAEGDFAALREVEFQRWRSAGWEVRLGRYICKTTVRGDKIYERRGASILMTLDLLRDAYSDPEIDRVSDDVIVVTGDSDMTEVIKEVDQAVEVILVADPEYTKKTLLDAAAMVHPARNVNARDRDAA